jgi:hypothetical protein
MRFMIKFEMSSDAGNAACKEQNFGEKMQQFLTDVSAESAYFTTVNGNRGGYIIVNSDDNAKMMTVAEPLFFWLKAKVDFFPVMTTDDLKHGNNFMQDAVNKWSF